MKAKQRLIAILCLALLPGMCTLAEVSTEFNEFLDSAYRKHSGFESSLETLHAYNRDALDPEDQLSYDLFEWYLKDQIFYRPILLGDLDLRDVEYVQLLRHHTSMNWTIEELYAVLLADIARHESEVLSRLDAAKISGESMIEMMDTVDAMGVQRTRESGLSVANEMQAYVNEAFDLTSAVFTTFPEDIPVVTPVPGLLSAAGFRWGSEALGRPNQVQILPGLDGVPYYLRRTISYHEAFPGHYVQEYVQKQLSHLPEFRRKWNFRAYGEAWALYGEQLAWDLGLYEEADLLHQLGFVESKLWRSTFALMDVALHGMAWSYAQAEAFVLERLNIDLAGAQARLNRILDNPGDATASYVGYRCFVEFREQMQEILGVDFNLVDYHRIVLESGPMPMEILERVLLEALNSM